MSSGAYIGVYHQASSSSTLLSNNLGTFTVIQDNFNDTQGKDYFASIVGNGISATTTSNSYYSSKSNDTIFTYNLAFTNIPSNATITDFYCEVSGHPESTSQSREYMCVKLRSGNVDLTDEYNFKESGTTDNTTVTLQPSTIPTISQLSFLVLYCRLGYYGGAINGATCYVSYTTPSGTGSYVAEKVTKAYIGINGIARKIKKGYIGVGGVAKQWYSSTPSLADLFSNAIRIGGAGKTSTSGYLQVSLTGIDTSTPYYCFLSVADNYEISKFVGSTKTVLASDESHTVSLSSNKLISTAYGGTIELLRFPSYADNVDAILSSMTVTALDSRYSSTITGSIDISGGSLSNTKLYAVVFVDNNSDYISISYGPPYVMADFPAPLFSYPDNRTYMYRPQGYNTYYMSTNGTSIGSYKCCVIFELGMPT